jgi:formiminoglutamase
MNLRIFFDPVKSDITFDPGDASLFANNISIYREGFPTLSEVDVVIFGVAEDSGNPENRSGAKAADEVRKKLYSLRKGSNTVRIGDLGNLRCGVNLEESYLRLKEVCEILLQHKVFPIIIGGSHDMDFGQFLAYQSTEKLISLLNIDATVDMNGSPENQSKHHIHKILVHEPNSIFHYSHLGYQSYLTDPETMGVLEKLYFEAYRIGQVRDDLEEMEPVIRHADMMTFDISAIRMQDAPGHKQTQPFGLTGEEACRICWYAGLSSKLTSAGFYEYNADEDHRGQTAFLLATMIWYLVEGFGHRQEDLNLKDPRYTKYTVNLASEPHQLIFYKHSLTEKWWMEVPFPDDKSKSKYARHSIVPCSYNDYLLAGTGELPSRWILTHAKLI